jgi:hypothetical protein
MSARDVRNVWIVSLVMALHAVAAEEESRIKPGHNLLQEADHRPAICPGDRLERMSFKDVTGKSYYLEDVTARGPTVFAFLSTKCPLAKRYTSRLIRLHDAYASRGVSLFAVFPNRDETDTGIKEYVEAARYSFPAVWDVGGYVARRLGATMTPQVFVVDQLQVLRYRGAIDDNRYETRVREQYLVDALDTILAKGRVMTPMVDAIGCSIHARTQPGKGTITYAGHIARILQDNCQSCHRSGQVAPFALTDYQEALQWQTEIKEYTRARLMPPWKAARGYGDFKNDISLTDEEIGLISNWVDQGAPMGNRDDMPPSPRFKDDWAYGQPDLVVEMAEEYIIGPEGEDDYRHFIVPYKNAKHRFVEAVDVRPGNRSVVHHVIAYVDTTGQARTLDAADPGPGYTRFGDVGFQPASVIGGWAPGNLPVKSPEGSGHWLPKECDIVLQVHYYRTGLEERDRTRVGVYFAKARRPVPVRRVMAINTRFVVPAGKKRHEVHAECKIEESSYLFAVTPHMHLIGETMQVTAHCPDGTTIPIVKIDDWDFNWQTAYHFRELQHLPAGTRVRLVATFDNSAANPNNPNNPPVDVGWGEKTTDEMCIAFLELLREAEYDPKAVAEN